MDYQTITQPFEPVWDMQSEILILGSFPSVLSRKNAFYYGNPQNRFWKMLAGIYGEAVPESIEEKCALILSHHLAVWDVIESCEIIGSSDSSIRNVVPADIAGLMKKAPIKTIICNGGKSYEVYRRYQEAQTGIRAIKLPSTSPANAAWSLERLINTWAEILLQA